MLYLTWHCIYCWRDQGWVRWFGRDLMEDLSFEQILEAEMEGT